MSKHDNKHDRREPSLGHLEDPVPPAPTPADDGLPRVRVETDSRRAHPPAPPRPSRHPSHRSPSPWRSWLWPLLAILLAAVLAWAWLNQNELRAMLPRTQLNSMLIQAGQALAAGDLEGANGASAQELYTKVLQEEPDNNQALKGLRAVGKAELARASSAIRAGKFQLAAVSLANARGLLGGGTDVEQVATALQKAQHPTWQVNAVIGKAQQALAQGRVAGADGAAALFRKALATDSHNAVARHGLDRAGDLLATRARTAIQHGDLATAGSLVDKLGTWLPQDGELPALRAQLLQARQAATAASVQSAASVQPAASVRPATSVPPVPVARPAAVVAQAASVPSASSATSVEQGLPVVTRIQPAISTSSAAAIVQAAVVTHLTRGEADLHQGRFTGKGGDNALDQFKAVLKLDPDNAQARAGLRQVALALVLRANAAMDEDDAGQARALLARAARLDPQSSELASAQARLQAMPQPGAATTSVTGAPAPALTPLQKVEVGHLLRRAQTAVDAGRIMLPPGDSAYDLYRQVLTIDAGNAVAQAGLKSLAGKVITLFNQAMAAHRLDQAGNYLVTMQSLEPGSLRATTLAQRLGNAWLDRAEQDASHGQHAAALKALKVASGFKPDPTRLAALRQRLQQK
ncbi:MAG TPA: hypothetical protein VF269_06110 [Rhodanobacteraceae bacterium]